MNIEDLYHRYLKLTGEPAAAATLVLAEAMAGHQPQMSLSAKQAGKAIGVSTWTIYDLCREGKLRHQRVGRAVRIRPADLEAYNEVSTRGSTGLRCLKRG